MSFSNTILYDAPHGFTYDASKIQFASGKASLKLAPHPGQVFSQAFASGAGFTYDSTKAEFVAGTVRQVDQRPANATYYASFSTVLAASWANGPTAITALNGATVTGGFLDLRGSSQKSATFDATGSVGLNAGTVTFRVTPNYSGSPSVNQVLVSTSASANSANSGMIIQHITSGILAATLLDSVGSNIVTLLASWSPTSGTEYTVRFTYISGELKLYLNGALQDTHSNTFTRTPLVTYGILGQYPDSNSGNSDFQLRNLAFYSAVVAPATTILSETIYPSTTVVLPAFSYTGVGTILAVEDSSVIETGTPRYIVGNFYWTGSAWTTSDGSYSQANTSAEVIAHLPALTVTGATSVVIRVLFMADNAESDVDNLSVTVTGQIYSTDAPTIDSAPVVRSDTLYSFAAVSSATGSNDVKFLWVINDQPTYWDGTNWVASIGDITQSNSATEINDNVSALNIESGADLYLRAFLLSATGQSTPDLTSATVEYDFASPALVDPSECIVYSTVRDILGEDIAGAKLIVTPSGSYFYGDQLILPIPRTATTDSLGRFEISLVETVSVSKTYLFQIQYGPKSARITLDLGTASVPNQQSINLSDLTFI